MASVVTSKDLQKQTLGHKNLKLWYLPAVTTVTLQLYTLRKRKLVWQAFFTGYMHVRKAVVNIKGATIKCI
jgi:hypothetical protein